MKPDSRFWFAVLVGSAACMARGPAAEPVAALPATNLAGIGHSLQPLPSADGRWVVFVSHAPNLVTNDDQAPWLDVFARDLLGSNTVCVSLNSSGHGGGNGDSFAPAISSNGQVVVFESLASNLAAGDTNRVSDVFVRNLQSSTTLLASGNAAATASGNGASRSPMLSANGRWVAFESTAPDLVSDDTNNASDVFVRDLQTGTTLLVSVNAAGTGAGDGPSDAPAITPDGRFVVFTSTATDIVPGPTNRLGEVFVRDMQNGVTLWGSSNATRFLTNIYGSRALARSFLPKLSADGRVLVYYAFGGGEAVRLIRHEMASGLSTVLASSYFTNPSPASVSTNGDRVAYDAAIDTQGRRQIYVHDAYSGSTAQITWEATAPDSRPQSWAPGLSADGRYVVFLSSAARIGSNPPSSSTQVYACDVLPYSTPRPWMLSTNMWGEAGRHDASTLTPAIIANGHAATYASPDGDLTPGDHNGTHDVFFQATGADPYQTGGMRRGFRMLVSQPHHERESVPGSLGSRIGGRAVSADGCQVAFLSYDGRLATGDTNGQQDVFLNDLAAGKIRAVSVQPLLETNGGGSGLITTNAPFRSNWAALDPALSADGKKAAFTWRRYLVADGGSSYEELVYLWSAAEGWAAPVSVPPAVYPNIRSCRCAALSPDGRYVAYQSPNTDLVLPPTNPNTNVFVRDLVMQTNLLASPSVLWTGGGSGHSTEPQFSPDSRWIFFASRAHDLVTNGPVNQRNLYARDLRENRTRLISINAGGTTACGFGNGLAFSADASHVAFVSASNAVLVHDLGREATTLVHTNGRQPSISVDGRWVAFVDDSVSPRNIVVADRQTGETSLASVNAAGLGGGNGDSFAPALSWDGRYVVFASRASDLAEGDANHATDIFVRDRVLNATLLVSRNLPGTGSGDRAAFNPIMAANGRTVVFESAASNLAPGDYNGARDLFRVQLGGSDSDHDGLDDGWELAFFNSLERDGTGDFDEDGQSDLAEQRAGTDPTQASSILRILTATLSVMAVPFTEPTNATVAATVQWVAAPGRTYRVQYKDGVIDPGWTDLPGTFTTAGTTGAAVDTNSAASPQRYYRVVLAD